MACGGLAYVGLKPRQHKFKKKKFTKKSKMCFVATVHDDFRTLVNNAGSSQDRMDAGKEEGRNKIVKKKKILREKVIRNFVETR